MEIEFREAVMLYPNCLLMAETLDDEKFCDWLEGQDDAALDGDTEEIYQRYLDSSN